MNPMIHSINTRLRLPLLTLCFTLLCCSFSFEGKGQVTPPPTMDVVLVTFPFTGEAPNPVDVFSGLTATDFSVSAGNLTFGSTNPETWTGSGIPYAQGVSGWDQPTAGSGKFFTFTLQTDTADSFDLTSFSFLFRSTSAGPESITLLINGVEINTIIGANSGDTTLHIEPLEAPELNNLTSAEVKIIGWNATTGGGDFRVDDVQLNGIVNLGSDPILITNPVAIENLNYIEFNGPSDSQSFELSGANLDLSDVDLVVPAMSDFEISDDDTDFSGSLNFPAYDGSATTIYVRLKEGLAINTYSDDITISGGGADPISVSLSGEVQPQPILGWQIDDVNVAFVLDFDNTAMGANEGQYNGSGFESAPATGRLNSNAFATTGMSDGNTDFGDTSISGDYARGSSIGGVTAGGFYAFEVMPNNHAFGIQPGGNDFTPGNLTLRLQNQTGSAVTEVDLAYLIYQFNDQGRASTFNFAYSEDDLTYTDIAALDFTSTEATLGDPVWEVSPRNTTITGINIPDGAFFYLQWTSDDVSGSGSRDELALDNIRVILNPIIETYVYEAGSWLPTNPNGVITPNDNIEVVDGTATLTADIELLELTVASGAELEVEGSLKANGNINNDGTIIFKSTSTVNTAQLDTFTGVISGSGEVTIERFIPARRAFRFLSSAVTTSGTINANWQEGQNNTGTNFPVDNINNFPGLGTHITGSTTGANGFDATPSGNYSLFTLSNTAQAWEAVTNTNVNTINSGTPYRLMVRGDRSINVTDNSATPTNTTLRTTGTLHTGSFSLNSTEGDLSDVENAFNFFGNPYPAAVDMNEVITASTNINPNFYYIWDPTLSGNNGRGAYVTIDLPAGTNGSLSAANKYLQPGQAAFVLTEVNGTTSLQFEETQKNVAAPLTTVFDISSQMDVRLYRADAFAAGETPSDGLRFKFSESNTNDITPKDAPKLFNQDENLASSNDDRLWSIESRALPLAGENIPLLTNAYRTTDYVFEAQLTEVNDITALLRDHFTGIDTVLENNESTLYAFNIDPDDAESSASDRFEIVFEELLSTHEVRFGNGFVLFPNPAQGEITLATKGIVGEEVTLQIINVLGQSLYTDSHTVNSSGMLTLDASSFSQGVYVLKLTHNKGTFTTKFIKE